MTSTGNDIVALKAIDIIRTKQHNFYSKILSDSENPLYNEFGSAGIPFENFIWLLWSIKESAFKYLQRIDPELIFTPVKFIIEKLEFPPAYPVEVFDAKEVHGTGFDDKTAIRGIIIHGSYTLYSRSILNKEFIVSVVNRQNDFDKTCWGVQLIGDAGHDHQSEAVRLFLTARLQKLHGSNYYTIGKNSRGIPVLLKNTEEITIPVSLSHHGQFVAYAFESDHLPGEIQP